MPNQHTPPLPILESLWFFVPEVSRLLGSIISVLPYYWILELTSPTMTVGMCLSSFVSFSTLFCGALLWGLNFYFLLSFHVFTHHSKISCFISKSLLGSPFCLYLAMAVLACWAYVCLQCLFPFSHFTPPCTFVFKVSAVRTEKGLKGRPSQPFDWSV